MENVNIAGGGCGMQQEENQCPWVGIWVCLILAWLSLFRSGYPCYWSWYVCVFVFVFWREHGVFCLVQIWGSCLLLFWVFNVFVSLEKFWVCGFASNWVGYWFMGLFLRFIYGLVWFGFFRFYKY